MRPDVPDAAAADLPVRATTGRRWNCFTLFRETRCARRGEHKHDKHSRRGAPSSTVELFYSFFVRPDVPDAATAAGDARLPVCGGGGGPTAGRVRWNCCVISFFFFFHETRPMCYTRFVVRGVYL